MKVSFGGKRGLFGNEVFGCLSGGGLLISEKILIYTLHFLFF